MVHNIIKYFIKKNIDLVREDFKEIADMIKAEFESEDINFYYADSDGGKNPKGALFSRYNYQTFSMRKNYLLTYKNKMKKHTKSNVSNEGNADKICFFYFYNFLFTKSPVKLVPTENQIDDVDWLKKHKVPWATVEQKWSST